VVVNQLSPIADTHRVSAHSSVRKPRDVSQEGGRKRWQLGALTTGIAAVSLSVLAGAVAAPANALLGTPRPRADLTTLAHERCVMTSSIVPCQGASTLAAASSGAHVLVVWSNVHRVRGAFVGRNGRLRFRVRDVGPADESSRAISVTGAPEGDFVVAWLIDDGAHRSIRLARLDANGGVAERSALDARYVPASVGHLGLAAVGSGYLLFATDTPNAWQEGPTRLRVLHLDTQLRPAGEWRGLAADVDDPALSAMALDGHEGGAAAVTAHAADGGAARTFVVDENGQLLSERQDLAVRSASGGRLLPVPATPRTLMSATSRSVPPALADTVLVGDQPRRLWYAYPKGLLPNGLDEQWVTGPGVPSFAWLATTGVGLPQLVATADRAFLVGLRPGRKGHGGGQANDVVIASVP
jgi:hypothetical protein